MSSPPLRRLPSLGTDNTIISQDESSPADDRPSSPSVSSHRCNEYRIPLLTHKRLPDRPLELYQEQMQLNLIRTHKRLPDRPLELYQEQMQLNLNIWFKRIRIERQNPIRIRKRLPDRPLELYIE